jgi:hypothetical protein
MATGDSHGQNFAACTAGYEKAKLILLANTVFVFRNFLFSAAFGEWLLGFANQVFARRARREFSGWLGALIYIAAGCDE